MKKPIYVTQPFMPPLEEFMPFLQEIWGNKVLTNGGPFHQQLEDALCQYLGVKQVSLFSNGTLALITALQSLRITGEVLTTPYSFVATAHSLLWHGNKPVFVDVSRDTLNMDQNVALPALPVGQYTGTFTAGSDENASEGQPDNNVYLRTFTVTDNTYSIDEIGNHPPGYEVLNATGTQTFTGGADGLITFSYYPVLTTMTVTGVEFLLASGSVAGGTAIVSLRDTLNVLPPNNDVGTTIAVSGDHVLTAGDIALGRVGVAFTTPVVLPPGHYFAGVENAARVSRHATACAGRPHTV